MKDNEAVGCFIAVWLVYVLLFLAFWGSVIFVGMHFILKAW